MEGPASTEATRNGGARRPEAHGEIKYDASVSGSDLLIVGAGPSGLATAIAAHKAGLDYAVLEKGALVESIFRFPRQMTFFTTPDLLEIGGLPFVTPYEKPTQGEALRYYRRVADTYDLRLELGCAVTRLERDGDVFRLEVRRPSRRGAPRLTPRGRRHGLLRQSQSPRRARRGPAPRFALLDRGARLLPPTRGRRGWQELGRHRRARAPQSGGPGHPRAPSPSAWPTGSSTGSSPTSRIGSRKGRSRRDSRRRSCASSPSACT